MIYHYKRPAVINAYAKQKEFIDDEHRFTIVEATSKAGKTVGCIVWIFEQALQGKDGDNCWWIAPIFPVAKIAFRRMKRFIKTKEIFKVNESELSINLFNGVTIFFKGADNPDSLYGEDVIAAILDESTRMKEDSWTAVFSTLTATNGKCKIIGNVNGVNNWSYKLARRAEQKELVNWNYFKITASDAVNAGVLKQEAINMAQSVLPEGVFLELYYGIPFENAANKFFYSFDEKKHVGKCSVDTEYPIYLSFDFNYNPICCGIFQYIGGVIYCPEIIKLNNSNIYTICQAIKSKYPYGTFLVTGDASGSAHSAMVKDNLNYYRIIKAELQLNSNQIQVPSANPKFEQNQILCNSVLEHIGVQIDPDKASQLIFDLKFAQMDSNKKLIKTDRNDPTQQLDAGDLWRYYCNQYHRYILKYQSNDLVSLNENSYAA